MSGTVPPAPPAPEVAPPQGFALGIVAAVLAVASVLFVLVPLPDFPYAIRASLGCLVAAWVALVVDAWRRGVRSRAGLLRGVTVGTLPLALPVFSGLGPIGVLGFAAGIALVWGIVGMVLMRFVRVETSK